MQLIAIDGDPTSNSYITLDDANFYFETLLSAQNTTWFEADNTDQIASLISATRLLDQNVVYNGEIATDTQALRWPRSGAYNQDNNEFVNTLVPAGIKNIVCMLAQYLIENGGYTASTNQFQQLDIGSLKFKYKDSVDGPFPPNILEAIDLFGSYEGAATSRQIRAIRLERS